MDSGTGGIPGNDDAGTMSAWLVFSALGLYPSVPGRADLALTTPLFPSAVVHLGSGRDLVIRTSSASAENRYIQTLRVDGRPSPKPWIPASMVFTGGVLQYTVGGTPNTDWGSRPSDVPPQVS